MIDHTTTYIYVARHLKYTLYQHYSELIKSNDLTAKYNFFI